MTKEINLSDSDSDTLNSTSDLSFDSKVYCSSNDKFILNENLYHKNYYLKDDNYNQLNEKINKIISILGEKRNKLDYPQITVVGDQSSGKSSLLETIFNIKLPTASGTCTKCPIVIKSKNNDNLKETKYYLESDDTGNINEDIVCEKIKDLQNKYTEGGNLVSDKEIILQIEGFDLLDITIVDLPGIIHQGKDIETIQDIIKKYIVQKNTIILVVNQASIDEELNTAHRLAKMFDLKQERTMTIYTKCDTFQSDEQKEDKSKKINYGNNIHAVICNPNGKEYDEEYENDTFRKYNICEEKSGINSLKIKLEQMYCNLIRENAPKLEEDIEEKINQSKNKLSELGERNKEKSEIVRDIKNILFEKFDRKKFKIFLNNFEISIKKVRKINNVKEFVESNFEEDIFRARCFQGEDTFNKRLNIICDEYIKCGLTLKIEIQDHLRKLFNGITFNFVDENSNAIIFKYVNNKLDTIMSNFEEQLIKEIDKERECITTNHYFEDIGIYKKLKNIIDNTPIIQNSYNSNNSNNSNFISEITNLYNNYKKLSLEERQKENIVDALTNYQDQDQSKSILHNVQSVILIYIDKEIKEWINCDLCEFIRDNEDIKEDNKIRKNRIELCEDIKKYEDCLNLLKN